MCFYIQNFYSAYSRSPLTAKEDIKVYKFLCLDNRAYYQPRFQYSPNRLHRLGRSLKPKYGKIHNGFHSYDSAHRAEYARKERVNLKVCSFIIPKGAKYFHNSDKHEYVSTSIRTEDLTNLSDLIQNGTIPSFCEKCGLQFVKLKTKIDVLDRLVCNDCFENGL